MRTRKRLRAIAMGALICMVVCTVTACTTTLNGTYTTQDELIEQSITFKDDNVVEVSAFGIDVTGEYLIEDGEITITYSLLGLSYDWVRSFKKNGSSVFIDGTEFVKEK